MSSCLGLTTGLDVDSTDIREHSQQQRGKSCELQPSIVMKEMGISHLKVSCPTSANKSLTKLWLWDQQICLSRMRFCIPEISSKSDKNSYLWIRSLWDPSFSQKVSTLEQSVESEVVDHATEQTWKLYQESHLLVSDKENVQVLTHKRSHLSPSLVSLARVLALQCYDPVQVIPTSIKIVMGWLWHLQIIISCRWNSRNRKQTSSFPLESILLPKSYPVC